MLKSLERTFSLLIKVKGAKKKKGPNKPINTSYRYK